MHTDCNCEKPFLLREKTAAVGQPKGTRVPGYAPDLSKLEAAAGFQRGGTGTGGNAAGMAEPTR
eukprot:3097738-Rhodomonas_salina.1